MADADLNLLRVFSVLYEERSVTRTAQRLRLTQSAVSHALSRLRTMLDDPLFVRAPSGLQATSRAAAIAPRIEKGLAELRSAMAQPRFEPAASERLFNISAGSYFCALFIPELFAIARETAPRIRFEIWNTGAGLTERLDQGRIDLALTGPERRLSRIPCAALMDEELVWVASAENGVAYRALGPGLLDEAPIVAIRSGSDLLMPLPEAIGLRETDDDTGPAIAAPAPKAMIIVHDAVTALRVVSCSDGIALAPRRLVEAGEARGELAIIETAAIAQQVTLFMRWHVKTEGDPALQWLRETVLATATRITGR